MFALLGSFSNSSYFSLLLNMADVIVLLCSASIMTIAPPLSASLITIDFSSDKSFMAALCC